MLAFPNLVPGQQAIRESIERDLLWGEVHDYVTDQIILSSTTVDARSTVTTDLQPGLCLGKISASNKHKNYSATATDGTADLQLCILAHAVQMLDGTNTARDQLAVVIVRGPIKNAQCGGLDQQFRTSTFGRFLFDDEYNSNLSGGGGFRNVVAKTANYTVLPADNNVLFTNQGAGAAVTFTLPTIAKGLRYRFFAEANQNLFVQSVVSDTMVVFNDAAADAISFQTANEIQGGALEVYANADATKWLVFVFLGAETQTPTIST